MNINRLARNYPGTIVEKTPFVPKKNMLYFYEDPYYIGIPSQTLSDRERNLLVMLLNQEVPPVYSGKGRLWYDLLVRGLPVKDLDLSISVRVTRFQMSARLPQDDLAEWRQALEAFFDRSDSFIYLSSTQGLIIEEKPSVPAEDLRAIANTLENDFSVKTYFQIGLRYPATGLLKGAFQEEGDLFRRFLSASSPKEVTSVACSFFSLLKPLISEWAILAEVRTMITDDPVCVRMIRSLWESQGNISTAAKHLFMHRNTLQYRIEKFYEMTGISLKEMNGLTLAYLSIL
ncbi:helix-turn-helix domain-containing protein [Sporolactobacillus sp. Y61]|jgi:sugar diacid utilization regulator|uniref:Helix-turn-helix domain-containing protein n=1 Tax=Sporolactobacillus sp. Y61 TaxID=3160863 RepID=A0AAU8IC74_9BACL|nr:helix-turn-helix domain-containing protein [Sporolactobacillus sp. THM19-2]RYL91482.1 hypothetical protein EWH91_08950 [Sporolactobacillus sp. THM19-2]